MDSTANLAKLEESINICQCWLNERHVEVFNVFSQICSLNNKPQHPKSVLDFMMSQLKDHQEILRKAENEVVGYIHNAIMTQTLTAETATRSLGFVLAQNYMEQIKSLQELFTVLRIIANRIMKLVTKDEVAKASPSDYAQLFETYKESAIFEHKWVNEEDD